MLYSAITSLAFGVTAAAQVTYQNSTGTRLRVDNGTYGPEIEEVHYCECFHQILTQDHLYPNH